MIATKSTNNTLSQFDVTILVISFVVGMGIFGTPARVAASSGSASIFFAVWIFFGLVSICGALAFAEIGQRLPTMGGFFRIFAYAYHPSVGFTINTLILVSNATSVGVVALIGADYVSDLLYGAPSGTSFNVLVAILSVAMFFLVNLLGLRSSSRVQNFMMLLKIGLMLLMIASIFKGVTVQPRGYLEEVDMYTFKDNHWLKLFLISMIPVSFSYGGYQQTINFGGEVKNPRILPKAIIGGIVFVVLLYAAINYAYTQVVGYEEMKGAAAIGALLCEAWFGESGAKVFDVLMFLSVLAYVNVALLSNPRVMYAMSTDKAFPQMFAYQHPKTKVFVNGLCLFTVIILVITFVGKEVEDIMSFNMFLESFGLASAAATLYYFRRKNINSNEVKGKWNKITPYTTAFYILAYAGVAVGVILKSPMGALTGVLLLLGLLLLYFIFYHPRNVR